MKPTTKQARAIINNIINKNNARHIGTWTDKPGYEDYYNRARNVAYRIFDRTGTEYESAKLLNKIWPGCANANANGYVRVKCTLG